MIDIDQKLGPLRLRAWALIVNFIFNATALYGLTRVLLYGWGWWILSLGVLGTILCIALLSRPSEQ